MRPHGLLRVHVDGLPGVVVGADRQQRQVERAEPRADPGEGRGVAGVAAEEHPVPRPGDHPGRPQRGVAGEEAPGEVPRLGAGERELADGRGCSFQSSSTMRSSGTPHVRRCAPMPSGTTNGAGCEREQGPDGGQVEVVVVVVRDHDRVDLRELLDRAGHRVQPHGAEGRARRHPLAPDGVEQHPAAVDLEQRAGVPEPGDGELAGLGRDLRADQRHRAAGVPGVPLLVPLAQQPVAGVGRRQRRGWAACCGTCRRRSAAIRRRSGAAGAGWRRAPRAAPAWPGPARSAGRRGRRRQRRCGGSRTTRRPASQPRMWAVDGAVRIHRCRVAVSPPAPRLAA